jgi:hypothetical protein
VVTTVLPQPMHKTRMLKSGQQIHHNTHRHKRCPKPKRNRVAIQLINLRGKTLSLGSKKRPKTLEIRRIDITTCWRKYYPFDTPLDISRRFSTRDTLVTLTALPQESRRDSDRRDGDHEW